MAVPDRLSKKVAGITDSLRQSQSVVVGSDQRRLSLPLALGLVSLVPRVVFTMWFTLCSLSPPTAMEVTLSVRRWLAEFGSGGVLWYVDFL